MISILRKPIYFFFIIFLLLNSLSVFLYQFKENNFIITKTYSIDYDLLNLVNEIDEMISTSSNNVISRSGIAGIDEIEQLYFKMINAQTYLDIENQSINSKIEVLDNSFKLRDYENRYILVKFTSKSKNDLFKYIENFDKKVSDIFRENIKKKLLSKQILLSVQENYETIKNIYINQGSNISFLFDPIKLNEKIENIKLTSANTFSLEQSKTIRHLFFYLMLSSVISIFFTIILLAFNKKIEW